ncbi:MAG: ABC transporter ATP-binding protein [Candidatus Latescibacteria bacterium]|nr:ABC transporter ATP-binding protein [Candidatus Latescibacterota bacterium]
MSEALRLEACAKRYGRVEAVRGVSLAVEKGELFGLIGPDGAGKTTLIRMICTLLEADEGQVVVLGMDVMRERAVIRARLGYMPQRFSLYADLSVEQNLRFFADLFEVPSHQQEERLARLYAFSRLEPFKKRKAGALSGGMKQKLALSCALIHTPELLVLDEPTFGVDPVSRQEFWEILGALHQEGVSILVSTAYMDEADLCQRVALMHHGQIAALGPPDQLRAAFPYPLYRVSGAELPVLQAFFRDKSQVWDTQAFGDCLHVSFRQAPAPAEWEEWQRQAGGRLQQWQVQPPSMEDVFMELAQDRG